MKTNSYSSRTTLWEDDPAASDSVPESISARGAWRAPSAVLSGRRLATGLPLASPGNDDDSDGPARIPRRGKLYAAHTPWWRPRSRFGIVALSLAVAIVLSSLVTASILTRKFLTHDAHFRIPGASNIQTMGLSEVSRSEVLPVFGEDIGRNIFFVRLSDRRKQLEEIPWIKRATVMRFLPDHLSVSVEERTPVAFVRQGQQVELVDPDGVILSMSAAMMIQHHYSFPVLTGIDAKDSPAARRARMAVYMKFVDELDRNKQHLTEQVSEIDLSDPEDLRATMPEQGSDILAHFGDDQFLHRLQVYQSHIAEWRQRYPHLMGVDLRYNGEVPLEMMPDEPAAIGKVKAIRVSAPSPAPAPPLAPPAHSPASRASTSTNLRPLTKPSASVKTTPGVKTKFPTLTPTQLKAAEAKKKAAQLKTAHDKALHDRAQRDKAMRERAALYSTPHY